MATRYSVTPSNWTGELMIRYVDCRTLLVEELGPRVAEFEGNEQQGLVLTAWQAAALGGKIRRGDTERVIITVPDFLHYGRLVNTGQAKKIAELSGSTTGAATAGIRAALSLASNPLKAATMNFWHFAEALMRFDLSQVPGSYRGPRLLHSHLMDFAGVFGKEEFLRAFFSAAGPRAGVHTQQVPAALTVLAQWNLKPSVFSYLAAPGDTAGEVALRAAFQTTHFRGGRLMAEVDSWPEDIQNQAGLNRFTSFPAGDIMVAPSGPSLNSDV